MMESFKNSFEEVLFLFKYYFPKFVNFLFFLIYGIKNTYDYEKEYYSQFFGNLI